MQFTTSFGQQQCMSPPLHTMMATQMLTDGDNHSGDNHSLDAGILRGIGGGGGGGVENGCGVQPMQHSHSHLSLGSGASASSSPVTMKVPLQSIGVDVPPQVLQVRTLNFIISMLQRH